METTFEHYNELAAALITGERPLLPQPRWGQDAAYIAFVIDQQAATIRRLKAALVAAGLPENLVRAIGDGAAVNQVVHR